MPSCSSYDFVFDMEKLNWSLPNDWLILQLWVLHWLTGVKFLNQKILLNDIIIVISGIQKYYFNMLFQPTGLQRYSKQAGV